MSFYYNLESIKLGLRKSGCSVFVLRNLWIFADILIKLPIVLNSYYFILSNDIIHYM
jgi:hypothetical protein